MPRSPVAPSALLLLTLAFLPACGGGGPTPDSINVPPASAFWVDAQTGDDNAAGSAAAPFQTISFAVTAAGPGTTIHVAPGIYDAVLGEVFPIQLAAGQQLLGDIPARGLGGTPTTIAGEGATSYGTPGTVLMADGSHLAGFEVRGALSPNFHHAVHVRMVGAEVDHNTFSGPTYGAIWAEAVGPTTIHENDFLTTAYGVYATAIANLLIVKQNAFTSPALPINILGASADFRIEANTFVGTGQVGVSVQWGSPVIKANTFNNPGGYTYGAVLAGNNAMATPIVRGNTFICQLAVRVQGGNPDLGTAGDLGGNDFSAVTGACVQHEGTSAIQAIGNTWPHTPPTNGGDITVPGTGSVLWGTAPGEQY